MPITMTPSTELLQRVLLGGVATWGIYAFLTGGWPFRSLWQWTPDDTREANDM